MPQAIEFEDWEKKAQPLEFEDWEKTREGVFEKPQVSSLESLGRGVVQGASLGLADELTGGLGTLGLGDSKTTQGISDLVGGQARAKSEASKVDPLARVREMEAEGFSDEEIADQLAFLKSVTNEADLSETGLRYETFRDRARGLDKKAQEANPNLYLAGELAGGVALPGSSLKALTTQGFAQGFGRGEGLSDSLLQGTVGAGGGAAAKGLTSKIARPVTEGFDEIAKLFGRAPKATQEIAEKTPGVFALDETIQQPQTLLGKAYQGTEGFKNIMQALSRIPEKSGADIREGVGALLDKNLTSSDRLVSGLGGAFKGTVRPLEEVVGAVTEGISKKPQAIDKAFRERAMDTAVGVGAMATNPIGQKMLAGSAAAGGVGLGLDVGQTVIRKIAETANAYPGMIDEAFSRVLKSAAQRGDDALRVQDYLLRQESPTYRQQVQAIEQAEHDNLNR